MEKRSYNVSEFSIDRKKEIERLGYQVDLFWEKEKNIYLDMCLSSDISILDCGAGPGFYSQKLKELFPQATITSLEYDSNYADFFNNAIIEKGIKGISVINGSLYDVEIPGKFDIITARLVFEHLHDPSMGLTILTSLLKEEGHLVLIDNDFENHLKTNPRIEELGMLYKAYCDMRVAEGGDPYIGRRLPGLLKKAGLNNLVMDSMIVHSEFKGDKPFYLAESSAIGITLVKNGYLKSETFEDLSSKWSRYVRSGELEFMRELYYCRGTKSSAKATSLHEQKEVIKTSKTDSYSLQNAEKLAPREKIIRYLKDSHHNFDFNEKDFEHLSAFDIGLDSITIMELIDWLEKEFTSEFTFLELLEAESLFNAVNTNLKNEPDELGEEYGEV